MKRFQKIYSLVFALLLTGFSVYALLDSFVIRRVYAVAEDETPTESAASMDKTQTESAAEALLSEATPDTEDGAERHAQPMSRKKEGSGEKHSRGGHGQSSSSAESSTDAAAESGEDEAQQTQAAVTDTSYDDGSLSVSLSTYRVHDTTVYVADVTVSDGSALKTAFSQNSYGRNVTAATSATAAQKNAVLAINGDNYGSREKGYVIRNGVLYRDSAATGQEDLVVYADDSFEIVSEDEVTAQELLQKGAVQVFSFGPGLVENGSVSVSTGDEVGMAKASNPRTAIAMVGPGHYLLVVSDGRTSESAGLTLYELAEFLQSLGAETAYNLDGGGSSTMVFLGQVVNNPTGGRGSSERAVTDIVYF